MGERTKYTPGTFSWTRPDDDRPGGGQGFYSALFGWEANDNPVGDGIVYSMMRIDGKDVAAISPQPQQQRDAGVPPAWNSYVTVESADAVAGARQGARRHACTRDAFDVMDVGRMGVVQDPAGRDTSWCGSRRRTSAPASSTRPGALSWNELATPRHRRLGASFYGRAVRMDDGADGGHGDALPRSSRTASGQQQRRHPAAAWPDEPPYWLVYFGTEDVDRRPRRSMSSAARSSLEPMDIGRDGSRSPQDPQGAVFALFAGEFDD